MLASKTPRPRHNVLSPGKHHVLLPLLHHPLHPLLNLGFKTGQTAAAAATAQGRKGEEQFSPTGNNDPR
jgi:hypothetical protein